MPTYKLPDLEYDYGALEPFISGKIMELHHDKHHGAYVKGANETLDKLAEARSKGNFDSIGALEKKLAFNVSGHVLHSLFWKNMEPKADDRPTGELADAIQRDFGSFETFRKQMTAAAGSIMGSGWAVLVWEPMGGRLVTAQIYDHQGNVTQAGTPLLVLDAWEHAFYLQYQNRKTEFFEAIWNVWDWKDVAARFEAARKTDAILVGAND
ncbi:MAG TPA: superoxide dismutase [Thermoanaerobaculia bacterium]